MKGLDTNVLIRYIVKDDPVQSREAVDYIRAYCTSVSPGFINRVVLCELVWVLEAAYRFPRSEVARVLELILYTEEFLVEGPVEVHAALHAYRDNKVDFPDALIGYTNRSLGCEVTASFDQGTAKMAEFVLVGTNPKVSKR